jgi:iron complex outermembrane receptor protein
MMTKHPSPSRGRRHSAAAFTLRSGVILALALILSTTGATGAIAQEAVQAPLEVVGIVLDPFGEPVPAARIEISGQDPLSTNEDGRFSVKLSRGSWQLRVLHPAYKTLTHQFSLAETALDLELQLQWVASVEESVTVIGVRASESTPVTKRNMEREEIEKLSYGQDVPELLQYTPAMNWYSDSGIGSNYSYFSMRGVQQTRINMTYDGVPLNDPAEHALYFNNFHDFTNAVDSIQIQRGVGTSSVGSPSYGGSVNFASAPPAHVHGGSARLVLGSYDTVRASMAYESGLLSSGFHLAGRFSYANTDGYRDHSGTEHNTLFINGGWQGDRSAVKIVAFSGREKSQLAWLAVEPEILEEDRRYNPLDEAERDDFGQDFLQVKYTQALGEDTVLTASAYYNGADGFFYLWDDSAAQNYMLDFGIDQAFVGSMVTISTGTEQLSADFGFHYNDFAGDHTLDIEGSRIYKNTGHKQTANAFAKAEYLLGQTLLFGDLQFRWAEFTYEGDIDLGSVDWSFVDPRAGVRHTLSPGLSLYASLGRAQREPARLDMLLGEDNATVSHDLRAVKPESVLNLETGVNYNTPRLALQGNFYAMEFSDEIALTGELSEIGLPLRRNVESSYRRGIEIDLKWIPRPRWSVLSSLNWSHNRIQEWTQFYDVYDENWNWIDSEPITYYDVPPLLTPELILNLGAEWATPDTSIGLMGRYVSESRLDNTGEAGFQTPAFTILDLRASQSLGRWWQGASPKIVLFVNNLLDSLDPLPSGYSYQYLIRSASGTETLAGSPYYYPLATRNFTVSLELGF